MAGIEVKARTALITGSSRGIALKLAECGVGRIAVHYLKDEVAAEETARLLRERGAEPVLIRARYHALRGYLAHVRGNMRGPRP